MAVYLKLLIFDASEICSYKSAYSIQYVDCGGFKGAKGAMAPGPALLVAKKGPHTWEKIEKKSQENIWKNLVV